MARSARRLGRGLDSLISNIAGESGRSDRLEKSSGAEEPRGISETVGPGVRAAMLPVEQLSSNPFQPRKVSVEDVLSLARSIEQSGLLQPIAVRQRGGGYEIIAGERRWAAAKSIGMTHVPVILRDATDEQMLELALVENIQREDLNAMDRAMAYRQFCEKFHLRAEEVARRVGEDRTTVTNYLRLLELPEPIRELVASGGISMGHARSLLGLADGTRQMKLARSVVENELSVRALEEIVRRERAGLRDEPSRVAQQPSGRSAHVADMERRFEEAVKTKVVIQEGKRTGTGRIILRYFSLDDFDRIADKLGVTLD